MRHNTAAPLSVLLLFACAAGCASGRGPSSVIHIQQKTFENNVLLVGYGSDVENEGFTMTGITKFIYKPTGENFASTLDAYGYGYAKYHSGKVVFPSASADGDIVEVEVHCSNGVDVVKTNRLFRDTAVLEIEYHKFEAVWFEDFYSKPTKDRVYSIYGLENEMDKAEHARCRTTAEDSVGHNHGDAFLKAAGVAPDDVWYRDHFIFGFYSRKTGCGLGFVQPRSFGLHDGWKLWSMYNYESFPSYSDSYKLPAKRWIFVVTGGREDLFTKGKAIADAAAKGASVAEAVKRVR